MKAPLCDYCGHRHWGVDHVLVGEGVVEEREKVERTAPTIEELKEKIEEVEKSAGALSAAEKQRRWRKKHPEKHREQQRRYYRRKKGK